MEGSGDSDVVERDLGNQMLVWRDRGIRCVSVEGSKKSNVSV